MSSKTFNRRWPTLILSLITLVNGSFMAIGPPAAPPALFMDSSDLLTNQMLVTRYGRNQVVSTGIYTNQSTSHSALDLAGAPYYWLADTKFKHKQPYAGSKSYQAFRNVRDFGAKGDGSVDDWQAIQDAVSSASLATRSVLSRCGDHCNATSTMGAIVYFPPGIYAISRPIIQYYFTSFISHPAARATIRGRPDFEGIALIDTDVYIPQTDGGTWWLNQNNFYRQIRNFVIDTRGMPQYVKGSAAQGGATGIHWQVSQACTLQNIHFEMSPGSQHRGIFMENGSGGFVSDLTFSGGKVCFVAGNQQYTARNLRFSGCETAIEMLWDWGFTWKDIEMKNCKVGFNATSKGRNSNLGVNAYQSTGSLTILDSSFENVKTVVYVAKVETYAPSVVLDNLRLDGVRNTVVQDGGLQMLSGGANVKSWVCGRKYTRDKLQGELTYGHMEPPRKAPSLLKNGKFFAREKPQYDSLSAPMFTSVLDYGVVNDGSYPNKNLEGINRALRLSAKNGQVLVFPAGVYKVDGQIFVPSGARLVGAIWSQIMAIGSVFADAQAPEVFIKVGNSGEKGTVEISDLMITGAGPTAGAIFMEWNLHERDGEQGSVGMWDTIFRVGGGDGSQLRIAECHQFGNQAKEKCMASSMMLRVTKDASIYLENMWFWVADHDIDSRDQTQINVYGGRGVLIESQGPSWVHSASNEHSTLYQWQLSGAKNVYLGHIQSETPYFQAGQTSALEPYPPGEANFPNDPEFPDCDTNTMSPDTCREAWALRIIDSRNVYLYGGGFYSFFQNYQDNCAKFGNTCQDKLVDMDFSENIWLYNIFTVGVSEPLSPQGVPALRKKTEQNGFATATAAYLVFANQGAKIGGTRKGKLASLSDDDALDWTTLCDWDKSPDNLGDIARSLNTIPRHCAQMYAIKVLATSLESTLDGYREELKGYDKSFRYFSDWVKDSVNPRLEKYLDLDDGPGNRFFSCEWKNGNAAGRREKCPPKDRFWLISPFSWSITYHLDDEPGFFAAIEKDLGIAREWVRFTEWEEGYSCANAESPSMNFRPGGSNFDAGNKCIKRTHNMLNFPRRVEAKNITVANPKDVIHGAISSITALRDTAQDTYYDMMAGFFNVNKADVIKSIVLPTSMIEDALKGMKEVKTIGAAVEAAKRKEHILTILNIVLMVLPFVAPGVGAAFGGAAMAARIALIVGEVSNLALGAHQIAEDPLSAPTVIVGILAGVGGIGAGARGSRESYAAASNARNMLKGEKMVLFSPAIREKDEFARQISARSCVRR